MHPAGLHRLTHAPARHTGCDVPHAAHAAPPLPQEAPDCETAATQVVPSQQPEQLPGLQVGSGLHVRPLPVKPLRQTHERPGAVSMQSALASQPPLPVRHSFTSAHAPPMQVVPLPHAAHVAAPEPHASDVCAAAAMHVSPIQQPGQLLAVHDALAVTQRPAWQTCPAGHASIDDA